MQQLSARVACLCALLCASGAAHATEPQQELDPPAPAYFLARAWQAASDAQLDALRGGFEVTSNLAVSFGFVRSVTINGDLVSELRFNLPDVAHITTDQAKMVSDALASAQIVQNGAGNSVGVNNALAGLSASTVVQNSLNNQSIQTQTVIDAGVNSLGLLHVLNTRDTLRDALTGAIGVR
jgi:hypothetical protein